MKSIKERIENGEWMNINEIHPKDLNTIDWILVQFVENDSDFVCIPRVAEWRKDHWGIDSDDINLESYLNNQCHVTYWKTIEYSPSWVKHNMKRLTFVKLIDKWFVDLEGWELEKIQDLQMVYGADDMLDFLTKDGRTVTIDCVDSLSKSDYTLVKVEEDDDFGATYKIIANTEKAYSTLMPYLEMTNNNIWLCNVCKKIFGSFLKEINFNVI